MNLLQILSLVPFFEGLPESQLSQVGSIAVVREVSKGAVIFSEGDEGNGFYVLASGRVKIFKLSLEGKEQILHIFGPGEPFGEVALFSGKHFPAGAQALEASMALFFPRDAFVSLIKSNPDIALNMLAVLSVRLRIFTRMVEDLSLKEVPGRVAAYLLYLSDRLGGASRLDLDITKSQLAALLGTIPETLSRILGRMSSRGLISIDGACIRILDREELEFLAVSGGKL
ncbi:MAG TPA: Crp/Fnr family transcriptional regulator, partial [Desulfobacteraceae bacterium]|nr:Crp/Fnr family transcriptional regulator [Desulfobacteraceae bacterium]